MNEHKYCRLCGTPNLLKAAFCANCGKSFPSQSPLHIADEKPLYLEDEILNKVRGLVLPLTGKKMLVGGVVLMLLIVSAGIAVGWPGPSNSGGGAGTIAPTPVPTLTPTVSVETPTPTPAPTAKATVKATPTPKPTATPAPTPSGQGTASDSAFSMTAKYQGVYTESNSFLQPDAGNKYVQIYVELTNKDAKDALMGNQYQFKLFDNQNVGHTVALTSFGGTNSLTSLDNSNPGEKTAGVLIFEIPAGNTPTKLIWDEPGLFRGSLTVNF